MNRDVDELPDLASAVLDVVDLVPPGRVVAYGDVAGVVGCGPRQVGAVMARWGAAGAWGGGGGSGGRGGGGGARAGGRRPAPGGPRAGGAAAVPRRGHAAAPRRPPG